MLTSLRHVTRSFISSVFTNPNSCITRSSCLKSSCPFSRNMWLLPSLPCTVSLRGRCLEAITLSTGCTDLMDTTGAPILYVPGTASSRFAASSSLGDTWCSSSTVNCGKWRMRRDTDANVSHALFRWDIFPVSEYFSTYVHAVCRSFRKFCTNKLSEGVSGPWSSSSYRGARVVNMPSMLWSV